jgi:DNA-binding transcriptional ArsR family regulator
MAADRPLIELRSKQLFGQQHRLSLMIAIARSPDGRVNPSQLAVELGMAQSAFQVPLRNLLDAGLLSHERREGRNYYTRAPSKVWDWVLEVSDQVTAEEKRQGSVRALRPS